MAKAQLQGRCFGLWTVFERSKNPRGWRCVCACGKERVVPTGNLLSGSSTNCGCKKVKDFSARVRIHGLSKSKLGQTFYSIKRRCSSETFGKYPLYGGRGIKCLWPNALSFINDMSGSFAEAQKEWPNELLSIERLDVNGDYRKENCTWIPIRLQARNRRTCRWIEHGGVRMIMDDWARKLGINNSSLQERLRKWPLEKALTFVK